MTKSPNIKHNLTWLSMLYANTPLFHRKMNLTTEKTGCHGFMMLLKKKIWAKKFWIVGFWWLIGEIEESNRWNRIFGSIKKQFFSFEKASKMFPFLLIPFRLISVSERLFLPYCFWYKSIIFLVKKIFNFYFIFFKTPDSRPGLPRFWPGVNPGRETPGKLQLPLPAPGYSRLLTGLFENSGLYFVDSAFINFI
jgi:hypothetical protein